MPRDTDTTARGPRRRRVLQILGSAGAIGLAGCMGGDGGDGGGDGGDGGDNQTGGNDTGGNDTDDGQAQQGGKLMFAQVKSPIEFDPIVLNDVPSAEVSTMVFDSLYTYGEGTDIVPQIASDMPTVEKNGKRYIVPLRDDAVFQNGDPVTAEDVAYSFTAPVEEETENAGEFNMIDTVQTVDETTVQFDLKFPFGAFTSYLPWSVVPKSVREEDKDAFNTEQPVGAGPFKFDDWTEGEFARVTRWDDYWAAKNGDQELPNLDAVEFVPVEEGTTRVTTLKSGENHVIKEIPPKSWPTVEDMDNAGIEAVPGTNYFYLAFNCKEGPTTDPKVREAVDYTFSMDQAVSNFVEPTGLRQYSPLPRSLAKDWNMPLDEWKGVPHDKDVDQAQSLFDEAGVSSDYSWRIIVPPDDKREQIGVTVANGLKEVGFDASVQRLDWGAFLEQYVTGSEDDYNMYTLGWAGSPDPDSFMYFLFAQEMFGTTNGTFYENDSVDEKIMTGRRSTDHEKRQQAYQEAITTVLEDRAHLPAYGLKNSYGVRSQVQDFAAHPVMYHSIYSDWNNVSLNTQ